MRKARRGLARPARKPRQRRGSTRERILAQAARLFASCGFNGVTMPAIAEASGITAGAIYNHFNSKAGLFFEVVRGVVEQAQAPPGSQLTDMVAGYTTRRLKFVRQMAIEMHYAAANDREVRRLLRRTLDRQIGEIRDSVVAARRAGALPDGANAEYVAAGVLVLIMGLMHLETLSPHLIGDPGWEAFVKEHAAALLGSR